MMKVRITLSRPPEYFQIFIYHRESNLLFAMKNFFFSHINAIMILTKIKLNFPLSYFSHHLATSSSFISTQKIFCLVRFLINVDLGVFVKESKKKQSNDCRIDEWKPNQSKLSFISDRPLKPSSISKRNQKTKITYVFD